MAADDPISKQFEIMRKRARQAAQTATQQEREGLKRRFAALGQVGSGAQIRAEAQAQQRAAQRLERAEETVGLAELAERQRQRETAEAREFARGEREAGQRFAAEQAGIGRRFAAEQAGIGRGFTAEQAGLQRRFAAEQAGVGREFARGERLGAQEFGAAQAQLGREQQRALLEAQQKFARGERLSAQEFAALEAGRGREFAGAQAREAQRFARSEADRARSFQFTQNELNRALQRGALDLQQRSFDEDIRRFDLEFARDTETINFNKGIAQQMADADKPQGLFEQLFGGLFQGQQTGGGMPRWITEGPGGAFGKLGSGVGQATRTITQPIRSIFGG